MRTVNIVVTIVLALAAVVAWLMTVFYLQFNWLSYPDIQVPWAITLSAAACLGWMMVYVDGWRRDGLTRCRRCNHILRGLSEPRCPECGEPI